MAGIGCSVVGTGHSEVGIVHLFFSILLVTNLTCLFHVAEISVLLCLCAMNRVTYCLGSKPTWFTYEKAMDSLTPDLADGGWPLQGGDEP